jgi:ankyrin repeat protein
MSQVWEALRASNSGDPRLLQDIFRDDDDTANQYEKGGMLCFATSYSSHDVKMLNILLDHNFDPNQYNSTTGMCALHAAADFANFNAVRILLQWTHVDTQTLCKNRHTPLILAVLSAYEEDSYLVLPQLFKAGGNVDYRDARGNTALIWATFLGKTKIVEILLHQNAQVNLCNNLGNTALHYAVYKGNVSVKHKTIKKLLVQSGATPFPNNQHQYPKDLKYTKYTGSQQKYASEPKIKDISYGKEDTPIPVVNDINEKKPEFVYTTDFFAPPVLLGDLSKTERRRAPHPNLEVFRTAHKGWGLRCTTNVQKDTFICTYVGEILTDHEAKLREDHVCQRKSFHFQVGSNVIDPKRIGNVGRFINSSCLPNLRATSTNFGNFTSVSFYTSKKVKSLTELCFTYQWSPYTYPWFTLICRCNAGNCCQNLF